MEHAEAKCKNCGNDFTYQKEKRRRCVCDECLSGREVARNRKKRAEMKEKLGDDKWVRAEHALNSQEQVAGYLGLTQDQVAFGERTALAKLRQHPDLVKLWMGVRGEGIPPRRDEAALLLEWQMGLAEMWQTHEKLLRENAEAAAECRQLIEAFYNQFTHFLRSKKIR